MPCPVDPTWQDPSLSAQLQRGTMMSLAPSQQLFFPFSFLGSWDFCTSLEMRGLAIAVSLLGASAAEGPCDIYAAAGTPCVAAHSTVRALFSAYSGPLYKVQRMSDNATVDVGVLAPGGVANAATQDAFCGRAACVIARFYDQTDSANHLDVAPVRVSRGNGSNIPVNASRDALVVGGERVYSAFFEGGMGYRNDQTRNMPVGDEPQTIYFVVSGLHYNDKCCFDYGNAELTPKDDGPGTMEVRIWVFLQGPRCPLQHFLQLPHPFPTHSLRPSISAAQRGV